MDNEEVYLKPNAKIKTNEFGEIERKIYKSLLESYTLLNLAFNEIKMQNIPIEVSITTTDTGFFKDFLNRKENNIRK